MGHFTSHTASTSVYKCATCIKKISFTVQNSDVLPILLHRQVLNMNITLILGMVCNYAGYY